MLYFVGVQLQGALLVGFGYLVVVGGGLEVEEVVEGYFGAFGEGDLVAETEDFLVWGGRLVSWCELDDEDGDYGRIRELYLLCSMRPPR